MIIKSDDEELHDNLNVLSFSEAVETHMKERKFESYISAVVDLASELDLDDKAVTKLLSDTLRDKIRLEAEEDGQLFKRDKPMMVFE